MDAHAFKLYGSATVGPKGQIVIPAEAREKVGIKPGDKVLVIGKGKHLIGICSPSQVEAILNHMSAHLSSLRAALKTSGKEESKDA